jgi:hypothetical protein
MTPGLLIFNEPLCLEEANRFVSRDLRHARHQGTATVNSSTCTSFSFCGIGC